MTKTRREEGNPVPTLDQPLGQIKLSGKLLVRRRGVLREPPDIELALLGMMFGVHGRYVLSLELGDGKDLGPQLQVQHPK